MTAPTAGEARAGRPRSGLLDRLDARGLRQPLAGAAFALAAVHLALIAYLDLLLADHDRYVWVINGPPPFDGFGGGPFQLWFHAGFALAIGGFATTGVGLLRRRPPLVALGLAVALVGVLLGPNLLLSALY